MAQSSQILTGRSALPLSPREPAERSVHWEGIPCPKNIRELSTSEFSALEQAAYQFGTAPETYDIACTDGQFLEAAGRGSFAKVYVDGRHWHIPGGLICPQDYHGAMADWLRRAADSHRRTIAVYSVGEWALKEFRKAGFQINKLGEEPLLELGAIDWRGGAFEWVRRQTHACTRAGLQVVEIKHPQEQQLLTDELARIQSDDLQGRVYSEPLKLLEGEFSCQTLNRRRLFIVRQASSGQIEGFLAASPMNGGQSWAFETYRKRPNAPRGTMAYLFRTVIDQLQDEGVQAISLCLVPGKGVNNKAMRGDDCRVRWLLGLWYKRLNFLFNTAGQDFFKSRFRPRYEDRFLCVYPGNSWSVLFPNNGWPAA
ncbi:MAG: DUF2156 domain-containing protein [Planctomycetota bacterium]|nr:MAG: DUF2156 domain-containing protein [Planctomycetota bacterium]